MKRTEVYMLLALGAWVLTRRRVVWPQDGWVWPVAPVNIRGRLYRPFITSHFGDIRPTGPHGGMDIVFPRRDAADLVDLYPPRTPNGGKNWFAPPPPYGHIVAARAGVIWSAGMTSKGYSVVISHGAPFATYYTHMEQLAVPPHERGVNTVTGQPTRVNAGHLLGHMGYSPEDPERVRHLHFAVWYDGTNDDSVDAGPEMKKWPLSTPITIPG